MHLPRRILVSRALVPLLLLSAVPFAALGANGYSLQTYVIGGGGGTSVGGNYSLSGHAAEAGVAGSAIGDEFAWGPGFWAVVVRAWNLGDPVLEIVRETRDSVTVRWNAAVPSVLEQSDTLGNAAVWSRVPAPGLPSAGFHEVVLAITPGVRFFRISPQ